MDFSNLGDLEARIDGDVITAEHQDYDAARALWNAMIDRRPGAIVQSRTVEDIAATVRYAAQHGIKVTIKGGGHSAPGHSMCDEGLVIDLSQMRGVRIDLERREAFVQGGCLLRDMDVAAREHGLATPAGAVSHTGVAGLTLGGGVGHIMRRYGLTIDSLLGCQVVTADGEIRQVDADHEPDLFWALRGGGGNFGVVAEFRFRLHEVHDPYIGIIVQPPEQATALLGRWRQTMADNPPDELAWAVFFRKLNGMPGIPPELLDKPMVVSAIEWQGDNEEGARFIDPLVESLNPMIKMVGPMSYLQMQTLIDDVARPGSMAYSKAGFFDRLTDDVFELLLRHGKRQISARSMIEVIPMGGAVARVPKDATAFPHRDAAYVFNVVGLWDQGEDNTANIEWVRKAYAELEPFTNGGAYVNYMGGEETGGVNAAYGSGETFDRLRAIKERYDPTNMFCYGYNLA